ncbi:MAG TPA: hypothetical protein VI504_08975 [Candidatus Eisenbacteria bacterium]|jgi:hypothetical protein
MIGPDPATGRGERGFILVGVVMFMLALTILGLSLFALSSYEAQFFYAAQSREQALQNSESGMELVQALIQAQPCLLENARYAVGEFGITKVLAYQARSSDPNDTVSTGYVQWDSTLVVVVSAMAGGEERTVQSRFTPVSVKNPYQQLVTCGKPITYNTKNASKTIGLKGNVWQHVASAADTEWTGHMNARGQIDPSTPPMPLANAFVDGHLAGPTSTPSTSNSEVQFNVSSSAPVFYKSPQPSNSGSIPQNVESNYEFYAGQDITLKVRGTAIWLVGHGVNFQKNVAVQALDPGTPSVLVIVAKPNKGDPADPTCGIWCNGGLVVSDPNSIRVYLVSEGDIKLLQIDDNNHSYDAKALSVFAGGNVELMGPSNNNSSTYQYPSPIMDPIANDLIARGALPSTTASTGGTAWAFVRRSWLETHLP